MGQEHVYVISDLHLGGVPPNRERDDSGFEMCGRHCREQLVAFIDRLSGLCSRAPESLELVVNGDFVDFLAERSTLSSESEDSNTDAFVAFTTQVEQAVAKLENALGRAREVFSALRRFVAAKHRLRIIVGNHDIELSLPGVRDSLLRALGGPAGNIELMLDGEAYSTSSFLIEHGNRYDGWNLVDHGALRAFRSAISRNEPADFPPPPGSRLVVDVMNPLKQRYRFIDLLKPENEAVIPILVALEPDCRKEIARIAKLHMEATRLNPTQGQAPTAQRFIAASGATPSMPVKQAVVDRAHRATAEMLRSITELDAHAPLIAAPIKASWLDSTRSVWHILRAGGDRAETVNRLAKLFTSQRVLIRQTFELEIEQAQYEENARRLARGRTVVMGHTHLAKFIPLDNGGVYINTGTWCPTMRLDSLYDEQGTASPDRIDDFMQRLADNRLDEWLEYNFHAAHLERDGRSVRQELLKWNPALKALEVVRQMQ